jgi:hypothetical protein
MAQFKIEFETKQGSSNVCQAWFTNHKAHILYHPQGQEQSKTIVQMDRASKHGLSYCLPIQPQGLPSKGSAFPSISFINNGAESAVSIKSWVQVNLLSLYAVLTSFFFL